MRRGSVVRGSQCALSLRSSARYVLFPKRKASFGKLPVTCPPEAGEEGIERPWNNVRYNVKSKRSDTVCAKPPTAGRTDCPPKTTVRGLLRCSHSHYFRGIGIPALNANALRRESS